MSNNYSQKYDSLQYNKGLLDDLESIQMLLIKITFSFASTA
jgi:hypothetical protein